MIFPLETLFLIHFPILVFEKLKKYQWAANYGLRLRYALSAGTQSTNEKISILGEAIIQECSATIHYKVLVVVLLVHKEMLSI